MIATSALQLLCGAYFNQDWPYDHRQPMDVVDEFIRDEPRAAQLPDEVAQLLANAPTEAEVRRLVEDELRPNYLPEADGLTYRQWLSQVADRVRHALS